MAGFRTCNAQQIKHICQMILKLNSAQPTKPLHNLLRFWVTGLLTYLPVMTATDNPKKMF